METLISTYCHIVDNKIKVDGKIILETPPENALSEFLSTAYKFLELNYPKFHKMDKLCKMGILATELVLREEKGWETLDKQEIAIVIANASSSIDSDRKHASAIADKMNYFPSPSVFVYTLPNIVIGEIAIKHRISGENAFFVSEFMDADLLCTYGDILLQSTSTKLVLAGWVNLDGANSEGFVYCVKKSNFKGEKTDAQRLHSAEKIRQLYKS